jgi:hypothetical protein
MTRLGSLLLFACVFAVLVLAQATDPPYQEATILSVKQQRATSNTEESATYVVTLRIRDKKYDVLYTPPGGSNRVTFSQGQSVLVKVGPDSLTSRDVMGRSVVMPILKTSAQPQDAGQPPRQP